MSNGTNGTSTGGGSSSSGGANDDIIEFIIWETGKSLEDAKEWWDATGGKTLDDAKKGIEGWVNSAGFGTILGGCEAKENAVAAINDDCVATAKCAEGAVCRCYDTAVKDLQNSNCGRAVVPKIYKEQWEYCTGPPENKTAIDWCTEPDDDGLGAGYIILIAAGGLIVLIMIPVLIGIFRNGMLNADPEKEKKKKKKKKDNPMAYTQWGTGAVPQPQSQWGTGAVQQQQQQQWGAGAAQQQQPQMVATKTNPQPYSQWGAGQQQQHPQMVGQQQNPYAQQQPFQGAQGQQGYGGWQGNAVTPQPNQKQTVMSQPNQKQTVQYGGWGNPAMPQQNQQQGQYSWPAAAGGSPMQYPVAVSGKPARSTE